MEIGGTDFSPPDLSTREAVEAFLLIGDMQNVIDESYRLAERRDKMLSHQVKESVVSAARWLASGLIYHSGAKGLG